MIFNRMLGAFGLLHLIFLSACTCTDMTARDIDINGIYQKAYRITHYEEELVIRELSTDELASGISYDSLLFFVGFVADTIRNELDPNTCDETSTGYTKFFKDYSISSNSAINGILPGQDLKNVFIHAETLTWSDFESSGIFFSDQLSNGLFFRLAAFYEEENAVSFSFSFNFSASSGDDFIPYSLQAHFPEVLLR